MKVTQGRSKWQNRIYHFLLVTTSVLHYFRDITAFTVYVTAYDLEKSFIFISIKYSVIADNWAKN